ncbi:Aspartyl aminopeptidase like protein [Verticillium longisporum]|nr:Aspartyl aminopeptidase like protein [Verticillium longisporum]
MSSHAATISRLASRRTLQSLRALPTATAKAAKCTRTPLRQRWMTAAPKPGQGPLMERRADRELPDLASTTFRWSRSFPIFVVIPAMNGGTVIKINANQRYATNSPGIVLLQESARHAGVPLQLFVVRNDSPCGSTIGPMLSAKLGVRTLDLGNPQLSMHSIRETGGSKDVEFAVRLFESFYERYGELEEKILVD